MFPGSLSAADTKGWATGRAPRAAVALALFASLFVVAPPRAVAATVTVAFESTGITIAESGTHNVVVVLNTDGPTTSEITVTVSDAGTGTATSGSDYLVFPATLLTFPQSSGDGTELNATVTITTDADHEGDETINLTLAMTDAGLDGATLGAPTSHTVTIVDPVGIPDFYNVDEGGTLVVDPPGVLINDTGVPVLTADHVAGPSHDAGGFLLLDDGSFTYVHDGSAPTSDSFTYRVADDVDNQSADTTVTITIDNVAPLVDAGDDPAPVMEEDPVAVNATFTDPGLGDSHSATIDWGDGTEDDCSTPACTIVDNGDGTGDVTGSHSYGAAAVYAVTVSVNDGDDTGSGGFSVQVDNANLIVNPTVLVPDAINEGGSTTLNATFDDSDNRGVHVATVDWGDGTIDDCATPACTIVDNGNGEGNVTGTHTYLDDGDFTVTVTVSDPSGDEGAGGATVTVANVAPTVQITDTDFDPLPTSSNGGEEGVLLRLRSSVNDPGSEEFTYDWKIRLLGEVVASSTTNKINYTPTADGTYFVSLNVDDGDGGTDLDSVLISIDNAVPVIKQIDFDATPPIGASAGMAVHFTDDGTSDTHVVTVSWGEGSPRSKSGVSPRSFSHTYTSAGTRNALVCVTDDDGGEVCEPFYVNPGVTFSIDSDFDGNGYEDLPIGVPGEDGFGAVSVLYATDRGLRTTADDVWKQGADGIAQTGEPGDRFGSALAWGDFNLDGYADLAVGAPTEDISSIANAGLIHVIPGSATGLTSDGDKVFHQGSAGVEGGHQAGDRFGEALATGDFNGDGFADLAVGVPNEDIGGVANTGRVLVMFGSPSGLVAARSESWDQNRPGVLGSNKAESNRGQALAAGDFDRDGFWDLAIGTPGNKTSGVVDSGAVLVMGGSIQGLDVTADRWFSQNTATVVNKAEKKDRFGAVLEAGDFNGDNRADLAIGIPREGLSGTSKAGAVAVLLGSSDGLSAAGNTLWHEGTTGVSGDIEANDRFGFALAAGDFDSDGRDDLAIGIPYQNVAGKTSAGDVAVLYGGTAGLRASGNQRWNEAVSGVKGAPAKYDHVGRALRAFDERADDDADLAIGIPDQNIAGLSNAGAVLVLKGRPGGISATGDTYWHQNTAGIRELAARNDRFGKAL